MVELGQIHKPEAGNFAGKRKLYCVANIYSLDDAPEEYTDLVRKYWDQAIAQIEKMETAGKIKKIFCEIITGTDDDSLAVLSRINEQIPQIIRKKSEEGGVLIPIEDQDILAPFTDWGNCLRVIYTHEVFTKIIEYYTESATRRLDHMIEVIDKNLSEAEAGLLILKDEDRAKLQFPRDIEVFLITPPSYDDIMRWFRERMMKREKKEE
ncbi:MAG: hypothetical protein L6290_06200 [Thermodesulfovibrionales bacterium]|nr:hypothetical protein [Thermodesulfovibrionales bacterium]